jgi:predicted amidohydrolase YtcJ
MTFPVRAWCGVAACTFTAVGLLYAQQRPLEAPDTIFHNGKIVTVNPAFDIRQAFAVRGDRFVAVGTNRGILALAGATTQTIDLHGRTVVPGLADNHNHQYRAASTMLRGLDVSGARSVADMLERVRRAAAAARPGQTVVIGAGWQPREFPEKRGPTKQELDQASPDHPVVAIRSRGQAFLNSAALKNAGLTSDTGVVDGDEQVAALLEQVAPLTGEDKKSMILSMQRRQLELGLTSIRELSLAPDIMRAYWELWRDGKLDIRVSMGLEAQASDADRLDEMLRRRAVGPGFGDRRLRLDSVAEFSVDGGPEDAYVREPLEGERQHTNGAIRITPEKLRQAMLTIHKYGWRPAIHVVGDKALDLVLDAYEAADKAGSIRPRRWVVEHAELVQPDQMERMARLGVLVSAQIRPYRDAKELVQHWGKARAERAVAIREFLDHKLSVSSGSDFPARTNNPFVNMFFYVTRQTLDGTTIGLAEKVTREEALRMITINNAYLTFEEHVKGSIEPGKLADFVVVSGDVMSVPEDQIKTIHPLATYVGGRKVFSRESGTSY